MPDEEKEKRCKKMKESLQEWAKQNQQEMTQLNQIQSPLVRRRSTQDALEESQSGEEEQDDEEEIDEMERKVRSEKSSGADKTDKTRKKRKDLPRDDSDMFGERFRARESVDKPADKPAVVRKKEPQATEV